MSAEENRVTPNFNAPEYAQDVAALNAFLQKSDSFEKGEVRNNEEINGLKQKIIDFEKENTIMKKKIETLEKEKEEMLKKARAESEERVKNTIAEKDRQIDELRNDQRSLSLQLSDSKKVVNQLSTMQNDSGLHEKKMKTLLGQYRDK